jgi:hypothetical protein
MEERKNEQECKISDWGIECQQTKTYSSSCPICTISWTPWLVLSRALKICILQRIKNDHKEKDEMDAGIGVPYILERKEMTNNEKRTILLGSCSCSYHRNARVSCAWARTPSIRFVHLSDKRATTSRLLLHHTASIDSWCLCFMHHDGIRESSTTTRSSITNNVSWKRPNHDTWDH